MEKFEYLTHSLDLGGIFSSSELERNPLENVLNQYGDEGWELITELKTDRDGHTNRVILIFKKRKE